MIEGVVQQSFSFKDLYGNDRWEIWTPVRVGFSEVGTPILTGRFHVIGKQCFIQASIVPGTTVASTAGTSYIELPIKAQGLSGDGSMMDRTTLVSVGTIVIDVTNSRCYTPSQIATGDTLLIAAWYEV